MDPSSISERVRSIVARQLRVDLWEVKPETLFRDLGEDELDHVEITMRLEKEFGIEITDEEADKIISVQQAIDAVRLKHEGGS